MSRTTLVRISTSVLGVDWGARNARDMAAREHSRSAATSISELYQTLSMLASRANHLGVVAQGASILGSVAPHAFAFADATPRKNVRSRGCPRRDPHDLEGVAYDVGARFSPLEPVGMRKLDDSCSSLIASVEVKRLLHPVNVHLC
jgi:hypothetical protein